MVRQARAEENSGISMTREEPVHKCDFRRKEDCGLSNLGAESSYSYPTSNHSNTSTGCFYLSSV